MPALKFSWPERVQLIENITMSERDFCKRKKDWLGLTWKQFLLLASTTIPPGEPLVPEKRWVLLSMAEDARNLEGIVACIEGAIERGVVDIHLDTDMNLWYKKGGKPDERKNQSERPEGAG